MVLSSDRVQQVSSSSIASVSDTSLVDNGGEISGDLGVVDGSGGGFLVEADAEEELQIQITVRIAADCWNLKRKSKWSCLLLPS